MLDVVLQRALADDHLGLVGEKQAHEVEKVAVALLYGARERTCSGWRRWRTEAW